MDLSPLGQVRLGPSQSPHAELCLPEAETAKLTRTRAAPSWRIQFNSTNIDRSLIHSPSSTARSSEMLGVAAATTCLIRADNVTGSR